LAFTFGLQRGGRVDLFGLSRFLGCGGRLGGLVGLVGHRLGAGRFRCIVSGHFLQRSFDVDRLTHRLIAVGDSHGLWVLPLNV